MDSVPRGTSLSGGETGLDVCRITEAPTVSIQTVTDGTTLSDKKKRFAAVGIEF